MLVVVSDGELLNERAAGGPGFPSSCLVGGARAPNTTQRATSTVNLFALTTAQQSPAVVGVCSSSSSSIRGAWYWLAAVRVAVLYTTK